MAKKVFGFFKVRYKGLPRNANFIFFYPVEPVHGQEGLVGADRGVIYKNSGKRSKN